MWYIYTIEFYSAIKKDKIKLISGKWVKVKIINMMVGKSQAHEDSMACFISHVESKGERT
jgi:hypothetical protein